MEVRATFGHEFAAPRLSRGFSLGGFVEGLPLLEAVDEALGGAVILHRHAGRSAPVVSALIALPVFISESVRLLGLSVFLMPGGGIFAGSLDAAFGPRIGSILNTRTAALLGMTDVHLPFMLFPLLLGVSLIPADRIEAARDLGAPRWQVFREIELPLAAPRLTTGALLTFVLALGADAEAAILGVRAGTMVTAAIEQRHLRPGLAHGRGAHRARDRRHRRAGAAAPGPARPRAADAPMTGGMMEGRHLAPLRALWIGLILLFLYVPIVSVVLASLSNSRYMRFPHKVWTLDAYREALGSFTTWQIHLISLSMALVVVGVAVVLGTLGAVAFARYDWRGRSLFPRVLVLPIFFPQPVLGLALLLGFTAVGIIPDWRTAAVAHLVWIVPIVTLIVSIRFFGYDVAQEEAALDLGATRLQVAREVTLPALWPGIFSGALFAFLLSWSNLPLSAYASGTDTPLPVWLFSRTATNDSPPVPPVAVIGTVVSALVVDAALVARGLGRRLLRG